MVNLKNYYEIPIRFIKLYPHFFNSKLNQIERHDSLGKNKKKFYKVNTNIFIENFLKFSQKKKY